jgi:hypothetical protein
MRKRELPSDFIYDAKFKERQNDIPVRQDCDAPILVVEIVGPNLGGALERMGAIVRLEQTHGGNAFTVTNASVQRDSDIDCPSQLTLGRINC